MMTHRRQTYLRRSVGWMYLHVGQLWQWPCWLCFFFHSTSWFTGIISGYHQLTNTDGKLELCAARDRASLSNCPWFVVVVVVVVLCCVVLFFNMKALYEVTRGIYLSSTVTFHPWTFIPRHYMIFSQHGNCNSKHPRTLIHQHVK